MLFWKLSSYSAILTVNNLTRPKCSRVFTPASFRVCVRFRAPWKPPFLVLLSYNSQFYFLRNFTYLFYIVVNGTHVCVSERFVIYFNQKSKQSVSSSPPPPFPPPPPIAWGFFAFLTRFSPRRHEHVRVCRGNERERERTASWADVSTSLILQNSSYGSLAFWWLYFKD